MQILTQNARKTVWQPALWFTGSLKLKQSHTLWQERQLKQETGGRDGREEGWRHGWQMAKDRTPCSSLNPVQLILNVAEVFDMMWITDSSNCFAFVCVLILHLLRHIFVILTTAIRSELYISTRLTWLLLLIMSVNMLWIVQNFRMFNAASIQWHLVKKRQENCFCSTHSTLVGELIKDESFPSMEYKPDVTIVECRRHILLMTERCLCITL